MKDGIHDISNTEYHADRDYISSSGLKLFPEKIDEYIARYRTEQKEEEKTAAMLMGSAIHTAILEPHLFDSHYVITPEGMDRRNKEGKKMYADAVAEAGFEKEIITFKDNLLIEKIKNSVFSHPLAASALKSAEIEKSYFLEHDGIRQKVRPDAVKDCVIIDLKTIDDIYKFKNSVIIYGYHVSAAMYEAIVSEMLNQEMQFVFIVVQKTFPYTTMVCKLDQDLMFLGKLKYNIARDSYKEIMETGIWNNLVSISMPEWADKNNNHMEEY